MKTINYEQKIINSALWAAVGDALGWITELSNGVSGVERRIGSSTVTKTVPWRRMIAGKMGPRVNLPAGTYSDDTQLRLAVSRSIRGNGFFDVECFAKIELPVWPVYGLGGGLGTKAAANNLSKRGVNWFSNFYERGGQNYFAGGGNGAAMRIQPHVWASEKSNEKMILDVFKDSIVTHGHPHGFCGAVFHALCLSDALRSNKISSSKQWLGYLDLILQLPKIISTDSQLATFWHPMWEDKSGMSLQAVLYEFVDEAAEDIRKIEMLVDGRHFEDYHLVLSRLGCIDPKYKGSGLKTAIASAALAYIYEERPIEDALRCAANEFDSDTDTIATMTGSILGATCLKEPTWHIQDREYIIRESRRLALIASGSTQESFAYPDLGRWTPPANQLSAVGMVDGEFSLAGLGGMSAEGESYQVGEYIWQWFKLPFGQTIIAKRRADLVDSKFKYQSSLNTEYLQSGFTQEKLPNDSNENIGQSELPFDDQSSGSPKKSNNDLNRGGSLDALTDEVIRSNFNDVVLGRVFNQIIDQSIESAIAFSAIIAKAKLARQRKKHVES